MEPTEYNLAFLHLGILENGNAFRGGCLATDGKTNPLEFRCTSPIRPTEFQRMLYGSQLMKYICEELVGIPLINQMNTKLSLILVQNQDFLAIRPYLKFPVLYLENDSTGKVKVLTTHPKFEEERSPALAMLRSLGQERLLEPFQRVNNAVNLAHSNKIGDSR